MRALATDAVIRPAAISDAATIAAISVRAWRAAYRGLMPDALLDGLSVQRRTENWTRHISEPASVEQRIWMMESSGAAIGFVSSGPSRDEGAAPRTMELYAIYVEPECVGRGFGARLFRHVVDDVARRGAEAMTLWALEGNSRAERFYERMGMQPDGRKVETLGGAALPHVRYRLEIERA